jgi:hypothetical protein
MRRHLPRAFLTIACTLVLFQPVRASAQQGAIPESGTALLHRMHDAYAGKWFHTLTFTQRTTIRRSDTSAAQVSTWYEAMLAPDRLRIDVGNPAEGNGSLSTADSTYVVRAGKVTRTVARGNPFIPFVAAVYAQPIATTMQQLAPYHFDMSRVRADTWQGRRVFVVGARDASDVTSPQFWVDAERLVLVRMLLPLFQSARSTAQDIRLDNYVRLSRGWLATKVVMYDGDLARQTEEYSDWRSGMPLDARLFDATQWSSVPHWTAARGSGTRDHE